MFDHLIPSAAPLLAAASEEVEAASEVVNLVPLLLVLPLAGFVFTAFFGRRIGRFAFVVPLLLVIATWAIAMVVVYEALTGGFGEHGAGITLYTWIPAGAFQVELGLFVDQLTACLLIVVTTIGMLVHLYSIGYMAHDPGRWRFFAYLNLFMFSMLLLVLGDSWLTVFAAWELVGLSSYLLIGFWYPRWSAALAAKKAFIVNRVGDVGFALGIMLIWSSDGDAEHPRVVRAHRGARRDDDRGDRPPRLLRRGRQERPVPAPRLAAGRDGGPDARSRPSSTRRRW